MKIQLKPAKFLKILGFLYLVVHGIVVVAVGILILSARQNAPANPGYILILMPALGAFAGYFIWKGQYDWWRNIIIAMSLVVWGVVLFTALIAAPQMEKIHKADADLESKLVKLDKDVERMFLGIYSGDINIVKEQLDENVFVEARNETGSTALHIAQNKEIIELLILKGADVNSLDENQMTPIFNKEVHLTKLLVEAGADIHAKSYKGNTPLMWYCYSGYLEGIKYMFSLGADVNVENLDGQTAYDIAEHFASKEVKDYLISIGAKPGKEIK